MQGTVPYVVEKRRRLFVDGELTHSHTREVEGRLFQKFRADVVLGNVAPRPTLGVSCRALLRHAAFVLLRLDFWVGLSSVDG